ncbi:MAG: nickel pincer cofactor biosynthesis protein LarB [Candidatus Eisenbacteria bacterium]
MTEIRRVLEAVSNGTISIEDALRALSPGADGGAGAFSSSLTAEVGESGTVDLRPDFGRRERTGIPEVVFAERKSESETVRALRSLSSRGRGAMATRVPLEQSGALRAEFPAGTWHDRARVFVLEDPQRTPLAGSIAVVAAGTSDVPVADEAAITAEFLGSPVERIYDVGVAGLHRIVQQRERLLRARALIVVAGMEGALPSVVGGLVPGCVIAVPTSVGYGASYGGIAALLAMLNSCAPGVLVVNIDNGFGAGVAAHRIHRAAATDDLPSEYRGNE